MRSQYGSRDTIRAAIIGIIITTSWFTFVAGCVVLVLQEVGLLPAVLVGSAFVLISGLVAAAIEVS